MKIMILGIGKTKHKFLLDGIKTYLLRLAPYAQIEEKYFKEEKNQEKKLKVETELLKNAIPENYYRILLDSKGKSLSSEEFSEKISQTFQMRAKGIVFIIGGAIGFTDDLRKEADLILSFSKMTFTHQMIRLLLIEQIYRAFSILNNSKYHK